MTTRVIPEQRITTCDCCGAECTDQNRVMDGRLTLRRAGLDASGRPVGDASRVMDLCDGCAMHIDRAIDAGIEAAKGQGRG